MIEPHVFKSFVKTIEKKLDEEAERDANGIQTTPVDRPPRAEFSRAGTEGTKSSGLTQR